MSDESCIEINPGGQWNSIKIPIQRPTKLEANIEFFVIFIF